MSDDSNDVNERTRYREFDCPECTANNPYDDGFVIGDEVRCAYCGMAFKVVTGDGRKYQLREE